MERLYITKIENGLRGLRMGTKSPETCQCGKWLNKLRNINEGLWEDYMSDYQKHLKEYNRKQNVH